MTTLVTAAALYGGRAAAAAQRCSRNVPPQFYPRSFYRRCTVITVRSEHSRLLLGQSRERQRACQELRAARERWRRECERWRPERERCQMISVAVGLHAISAGVHASPDELHHDAGELYRVPAARIRTLSR